VNRQPPRRWSTALALVLLLGGAFATAAIAGPPVSASVSHLSYRLTPVAADPCQTYQWTLSTRPADYTTWVPATQAHRSGHFWSSSNCEGLFAYWSRGQAFDGSACTRVRVIVYNRYHHWDYATGWRVACGSRGYIPATIEIPRGREISFECQDQNPDGRRPGLHCLYNPVRF
jgi:hypothetical protein